MLSGGVIDIGNFGHHRRAAGVAGGVGQAGGALGGRAGGAEVGPRAAIAVAGGRHHNDVGLDAPQVSVFQTKLLDDAGREILGEHIGDGNQPAQQIQPLGVAQFQGEAQLVAVLFVEIGAAIPESALDFVAVNRIAAIAFQAAHRLQPDDLRAHIGQQFHGVGNGDELSHLHHPQAVQRAWGGGVGRWGRCRHFPSVRHMTPPARSCASSPSE